MRKLISICVFAILMGSFTEARSQEVKEGVKKGAKKVGNKAAEVGSKTKSRVVDKVYVDKVGPDGQTIYINKHSKYYWVDEKGHRQYVKKVLLKDK